MIIKHLWVLKKYALAIVILYSVALTVVSLVKLNKLPDVGVSFGDKIFHFLTYCVLTFLWVNALFYFFKFTRAKAIIVAAIISIGFGILIEVLQGTVTASRASDLYDVAANTFGVLLAVLVMSQKSIGIKNL
ncbi:VanZ family protein [Snuella sedimenti]|uniref:VanZ family protein n=1 Tax=Snuella sedimenti TaxID=2798802 RepID=A0A8J7IU09_9FLAO|nr:VanZ family protein [Snuella sedimenti]MBJ6368015.1 VanZ family protein [Snuella sedimenti]